MRKSIFVISIFLAASAGAGAQTMYDALTFSRNDYYGTAKSIAMGNAMTAVGGGCKAGQQPSQYGRHRGV